MSRASRLRCQPSAPTSIAIRPASRKDEALPLIPERRSAGGSRSSSDVDLARYYDMDVSEETDDIAMYLALAAASDGPVLELASGSGRIAVPLAEAGHPVVGVDLDSAMLDRARARWSAAKTVAVTGGPLELVQSDMRDLALEERFDLAILAFNSLLVLPDRGRRRPQSR